MIRPGKMLREVLRSAMRKPATVRYPFVKVKMPPKFRGKLKFDPQLCIGCLMCMRDCPTNAITIRKVGDKKFEADIDLSRCIYCGQCVDSCPKKALASTEEFELAQLDRKKLKTTFPNLNRQEPPADAKAPAPSSRPDQPPANQTPRS